MSKLNANTTDLQAILAAVNALPEALDTSDATATPSTMLSGVTAYVDGEKITGNIPTKTASNLTASGATVTVPAGYYASQATKSVSTATQATPSISVDSAGKITASATQSAGYVSAGTKSATKQLTTQGAQTITPGTANKTIASGRYLTGTQTIKGDANLVAGNIKSGVSIFGVAGTMTAGEDVTAETNAYTDLLDDLETAIDELPDAGGGTAIDTCTVTGNIGNSGTLTINYSNGAESVAMTVAPNADFSFNPLKNSLVVVVTSAYGEFGTLSWRLTGDIEVVVENYSEIVCFSVGSDGTIGAYNSDDPEG